jgi:hypothetical protein
MKAFTLAMVTLLTLAAAPGHAAQTNLVQNINIHLLGLKQGRTVTNGNLVSTSVDLTRIGSRQVIDALGDVTGNSFSWTARLVLVSPLGGGDVLVQVRDGDNKVDVTTFFVVQPLSDSVQSSQLNTRTGRSFATDYYVQRFALQNSQGFAPLALHFDVSGFATETSANGINSRPGSELRIEAAGSGDRSGSLLILQGVIGVFGNTLEVDDSGGGGTFEGS